MKIMMIAYFFLASFSASADVVTDIKQTLIKCQSKASTPLDDIACSSQATESADVEVNKSYQLIGSIYSPSARGKDDGDALSLQKVTRSQEAWKDLRDADCSLEGLQHPSTQASTDISNCRARMTIARVRYLNDLFKVH